MSRLCETGGLNYVYSLLLCAHFCFVFMTDINYFVSMCGYYILLSCCFSFSLLPHLFMTLLRNTWKKS